MKIMNRHESQRLCFYDEKAIFVTSFENIICGQIQCTASQM